MNEKPLVTWKEIAGYFEVSPKTAMRWLRGKLCVKKIGNRVIAYPSDLEKYVKK